jgi:hypothetical protein
MHDLFAINMPDRGNGSNQAIQNGNTLILCGIANIIHFPQDASPYEHFGNPGPKLLIFSIIVLKISTANRDTSKKRQSQLIGTGDACHIAAANLTLQSFSD